MQHQNTEHRCGCGNMMGRQTMRGLEIKCRRCKRIHVIPWSTIDDLCSSAVRSMAREPGTPYTATGGADR